MDPEPNTLPWAALRLIDDGTRGGQAVEVLVDSKPIARLPACRVAYELNVHGRGVLNVGVHVHGTVDIAAGDLLAIGGPRV